MSDVLMELSQLNMFKVVAEQGSIIRASELLHCVPSNITNRIKLLEQELGVALFIRQGRGLVISPSGKLFLSYANKILSLCQEARGALDVGAEPSGMLSIGAIESSATGRLPRLLSRFHKNHPAVQMQFSTGVWSQLLSDILAYKLDGAVIAVKNQHPDIEYEELYTEELVVIASPLLGKINTPQDIKGKAIFMWPEGCPYRASLNTWLGEHRISSSINNIASYGTILGCVSSGAGVSVVPKGVFEQFSKIGEIEGHAFEDLKPIQNYFVWNRHTGLHRARDAFADLLKKEFKRT
jgi:DNA-binding transcriptional LysR family regulator